MRWLLAVVLALIVAGAAALFAWQIAAPPGWECKRWEGLGCVQWRTVQARGGTSMEYAKKDRDWRDYPIGTKAHACNGGAWLKTARGWTWNGHTRSPGSTFPTPGADAFGACIELPPSA